MLRRPQPHGVPALGHVSSDGQRGDLVDEHVVGLVELEGDGVVVDLLDGALLAADGHERRLGFVQLLVQVHVLVPEHDVVGGKGLPIGPLHAFAQFDDDGLTAVLDIPALRHVGHHRLDLRIPVEQVVMVVAFHVLLVTRAGERHAPVATVGADFVGRLQHERLLWQSLLDGRQRARLDLLGEQRRFLEAFGHPGCIEHHLRQIAAARRRLGRWAGWRRRCRRLRRRLGSAGWRRRCACRSGRSRCARRWLWRHWSTGRPDRRRCGRPARRRERRRPSDADHSHELPSTDHMSAPLSSAIPPGRAERLVCAPSYQCRVLPVYGPPLVTPVGSAARASSSWPAASRRSTTAGRPSGQGRCGIRLPTRGLRQRAGFSNSARLDCAEDIGGCAALLVGN